MLKEYDKLQISKEKRIGSIAIIVGYYIVEEVVSSKHFKYLIY